MPDNAPTPIADATCDSDGFIHGPYGSFNPVTGEGLPIDAPAEYKREILWQLIQQGLDSPIEPFDANEFLEGFCGQGDPEAFDRIMNRSGGEPSRAGDELAGGVQVAEVSSVDKYSAPRIKPKHKKAPATPVKE